MPRTLAVTVPSWIANPQDPSDEHDWVQWFAPARDYRGLIFNVDSEQWVKGRE